MRDSPNLYVSHSEINNLKKEIDLTEIKISDQEIKIEKNKITLSSSNEKIQKAKEIYNKFINSALENGVRLQEDPNNKQEEKEFIIIKEEINKIRAKSNCMKKRMEVQERDQQKIMSLLQEKIKSVEIAINLKKNCLEKQKSEIEKLGYQCATSAYPGMQFHTRSWNDKNGKTAFVSSKYTLVQEKYVKLMQIKREEKAIIKIQKMWRSKNKKVNSDAQVGAEMA